MLLLSERLGTFIFYKNIKLFSSWAQRFWTNTIYSHVSIYTGSTSLGLEQEFEADLKVRLHTFRKSKNMDFIAWKDVPSNVFDTVLKRNIKIFESRSYGFISWLTVFIRFGLQKLGFKNMHKKKILWGWGVICSELLWYIIRDVCAEMQWDDLFDVINEYNYDTFVPQDLINIVNMFPQYFILEEWL